MENKVKLSVALAVYNEETNLEKCLTSVSGIAGEIVIVDGGSTDNTLEIARKFNAKIFRTDNPPVFHINKQIALDRCSGEWILQMDADEMVTEDLNKEITGIFKAGKIKYNGFYIPRKNYFLGKWLRKGGQYPDYVIRFFRNGSGKFPAKSVHEQIEIKGETGYMKNPLLHFPYNNIGEYWIKAIRYKKLLATELESEETSKNPVNYIKYNFYKPLETFFSITVRHKGLMDGLYGVLFAILSALQYPMAYREYTHGK